MNEKDFRDKLKAAVDNDNDNFYAGFDEKVPSPEEIIARAEGRSTYMTTGSGAKQPLSKKEQQDQKRKLWTKRLAPVVSIAACVAIVFGVVIPNASAKPGSFKLGDMNITNYENAVANDDYANLYEKIEEVGYERNDYGVRRYALSEAAPAAPDLQESETAPTPDSQNNQGGPQVGESESAADAPAESSDTADAPASDSENSEFSDTNNQTEGVMEADIVKTNGSYIFAINSESLTILKANDGNPEVVSKIDQNITGGQYYFEMFITDERLICIRQGYNARDLYKEDSLISPEQFSEEDSGEGLLRDNSIAYPNQGLRTDTSIDIFDISNPNAPKPVGTLSQSGKYTTSRMIKDKLYLISTYSDIYTNTIDGDDPTTFIPLYAKDGEQSAAKASDICFAPEPSGVSYTVVSGIDAQGADFVSQKSILGYTGEVYASTENIYLTEGKHFEETETDVMGDYTYHTSGNQTAITRISIKDGDVKPGEAALIPGGVLNQFSIDEYNGVLRVVTTVDSYYWAEYTDDKYRMGTDAPIQTDGSRRSNALFTLNSNMKVMGKIENIAPDESVYSCRFMGDMAYFVTFRQVDPLFSVDVSNPKSPQIIGALKIPGFSEYLHPYDDGLLFGLGKDTDEGGRLKLSMFDNSDPANVKEAHTLILDSEYYSPAEYNHKAILIDKKKRIIAFPGDSNYLIYSYDKNMGFSKVADIQLGFRFSAENHGVYDDYVKRELRGLFIGDVFYIISPNTVKGYDMSNGFAEMGAAAIGEDAFTVDENSYVNTNNGIVNYPIEGRFID